MVMNEFLKIMTNISIHNYDSNSNKIMGRREIVQCIRNSSFMLPYTCSFSVRYLIKLQLKYV